MRGMLWIICLINYDKFQDSGSGAIDIISSWKEFDEIVRARYWYWEQSVTESDFVFVTLLRVMVFIITLYYW